MTQKDYVKEKLAFGKIVITGFVGAIITLYLYIIQNIGSNLFIVKGAIIILLGASLSLARWYKKLLDELKTLP
ncbi:Uncharacterised protein [uncultured archaeon]|nr:Uncharacterised protein [uncultured archaeon]